MIGSVGTIAFGLVGALFVACGCVGLWSPTLFRQWFPATRLVRGLSLEKSELYTRLLAAIWIVLGGAAVVDMWRGF